MDRWHHLVVLGACLLLTAPLELFGRGVYRQPRRLLAALIPVAAVFLVWDAIAVAAGVWWYAEQSEAMSGLGYTLPAVIAVIAVCLLELRAWRTGLFRRPAYWVSMAIVVGFQILVDGWLTKLSAPIVLYDEHHTTGIRFPFDIPIEDVLFGFALVTAVLLLWERRRTPAEATVQR